MSESEMVLRVERAIVNELERTKDWRATARAAIEAMRKPPSAVIARASDKIGYGKYMVEFLYEAVIDAALAPPTDGAGT